MISATCQRLESATLKFLLNESTESLAGHVFDMLGAVPNVEVINTGFFATVGGFEFALNFHAGGAEDTVKLPAVVVSCVTGSEDERGVPNYQCDLEVRLEYHWKSDSTTPDVLKAMEAASNWLGEQMGRSDLAACLARNEAPFHVFGVIDFSGDTAVEGTRRIHSYRATVLATPYNIV